MVEPSLCLKQKNSSGGNLPSQNSAIPSSRRCSRLDHYRLGLCNNNALQEPLSEFMCRQIDRHAISTSHTRLNLILGNRRPTFGESECVRRYATEYAPRYLCEEDVQYSV